MKKMNLKNQRKIVGIALLFGCMLLVVAIFVVSNQSKSGKDMLASKQENTPLVGAIDPTAGELSEETANLNEDDSTFSTVSVPGLVIDGGTDQDNNKPEEVTIDVPLPTEPEKPETNPPDHKPQTKDDLQDTSKVPEYSEEETTYIPEETQPIPEANNNQSGSSNLVPDTENPFLQNNIPVNGDGGEMNGEDLGDGEWGTGDKF